jgi:hypothetical protein
VVKSAELLTLEQRVQEAMEIIGKGNASRADVEATVDRMNKLCAQSKRIRSRGSQKQKKFAEPYGLALRKVIGMTRKAPDDFRAPPFPAVVTVAKLGIKEVMFDHEYLLHHLMLLNWICESWEKSKLKPTPDAYEKRLATTAATYLCDTFGIPLTATRKTWNTKASTFCRLAAVLYGDATADLQHYCLEVVQKRRNAKPG